MGYYNSDELFSILHAKLHKTLGLWKKCVYYLWVILFI